MVTVTTFFASIRLLTAWEGPENGTSTRAEVAAVLTRFIQQYAG
jgi:hypothetical protein